MARPLPYTAPFNTLVNVAAPGVLANDNTNGGGDMTALLVTNVTNGTLALAANGSFTYTPGAGSPAPRASRTEQSIRLGTAMSRR